MLNLRGLSCSLSMCGSLSLSLSSDVGDKWMHPEGINWIWEQSPAQSTRTDKHPPSLPSPSLPPFGTHTQTHASFIPVMPCRNVCHPPLSPSHHPTLMDQSVSPYPSHTHTHTHTGECRTAPQWIATSLLDTVFPWQPRFLHVQNEME